MAGLLSLYSITERIILDTLDPDNEYWVDVKVSLTKADSDMAQRKLMKNKMSMSGSVSNIDGDLDIPAYEEEMVVKSVVNWNLTDEGGNTLPIVPVEALRMSVQRLPADLVTQIYTKVNDLNKRRPSKEEDSFRGASVG